MVNKNGVKVQEKEKLEKLVSTIKRRPKPAPESPESGGSESPPPPGS